MDEKKIKLKSPTVWTTKMESNVSSCSLLVVNVIEGGEDYPLPLHSNYWVDCLILISINRLDKSLQTICISFNNLKHATLGYD